MPKSLDLRPAKPEYPATYAGFYDDEAAEGRRSIQQYFNVVKKRLPIILALTALVTAAVAFYMYRMPSQYQATTVLVIEPRKPKVQSKDSININFGNDANYYNTQLELLQSGDLMKEVVIRLGLYKEPDLFGNEDRGILSGLRSIFSSGKTASAGDSLPVVAEIPAGTDPQTIQLSPEEKARAEAYAGMLAGRVSVQPTDRTNLVSVSVTTPKPELSARVADKVADVFIDRDAKSETEGSRRAYDDLTKSIEDLKVTIAQQETELINAMSSIDLPLQDKGGDLRAGNLSALQAQLLDAENEASKIQTLYSGALSASGKGDILAVAGDNKAIQDARSQNLKRQADLEKRIEEIDNRINGARERRETLLVRYTPEYKDVIAIDAQIKELQDQKTRISSEVLEKIKSEGLKLEKNAEREYMASLRAQLGAAQQRQARAYAAFEAAKARANLEGRAETNLKTQKDALDTNRGLLNTYTQRQKEQELAIASGRPDNIKIAANAVAPTTPIGPQRARNIMVAFLVAFAVGIGLAFLLDYLDDSVKTSDDIGRHLGLPTLALIPHHFGSEKRRLKLLAANGNGNGNGNGSGGGVAISTGLITLEDRRSPMAEAYRHLRTSLLFSSAGKPPQTILITSSQPSEGKTTTAINTAITLAQADADVVIVDCDLRRPRLHNYFDLDNTQGLTNYLSGERNTEHLIKSCRDLPRLKVVTSGPIPPNPAELLSSNEMKNLLQFLRGRYKHVIIDSPPAISFTDAAILSTLVDGVVIVAMAGKSSIHLMRRFKHRLGNIGARIYGVVLNGIKSGSMEYDYYGTGYYEYYAKSDADTSTPVMEEMGSIHRTKP